MPCPQCRSDVVPLCVALHKTSSGGSRPSSTSFCADGPILILTTSRRLPPPSIASASPHQYRTFVAPKLAVESVLPSCRATQGSSHSSAASVSSAAPSSSSDRGRAETPLPARQLLLLAFLSLSEQTALNSMSPYLPEMVVSMPGIPHDKAGLYVGILASAFAVAQLSTNFLWGYASDLFGRKPVLLAGTTFLTACFCVFGFCRQYWQVVVVDVAMGLLNGNAACVATVLGEITDHSNQSKAFTYLPIIYSLGSITGPALGGILVGRIGGENLPFLGPNIIAATMLAVSVLVVGIWFEETLDDHGDVHGPWRPQWIATLASWFRKPAKSLYFQNNSCESRSPIECQQSQPLLQDATSAPGDQDEGGFEVASECSLSTSEQHPSAATAGTLHTARPDGNGNGPFWRGLLSRPIITLLIAYIIFQLSNVSYNSLYPIFAASPPPTGRGLSPDRIGLSLSLAGVAAIIFQAFLFQKLKFKVGSIGVYRLSLWGISLSMVAMPWIGYTDKKPPVGVLSARSWLYAELGVVLILKNICAVGGLSSVMMLVRSTPAPDASSTVMMDGY